MCFCQMQGNTLSFTLKENWRGVITITCSGEQKKRIGVDWGAPGSPIHQLDSCTFGSQVQVDYTNTGTFPISPVIQLFHSGSPCNSGEPAIIPLTNGTQTACEETATTQHAAFHYELPTPGETVQVTVDTNEKQEGEEEED